MMLWRTQAGWLVMGLLLWLTACATQPTPTPTRPAPVTDWKIFHSPLYGLTFEYPGLYDEAAYRTACGLREGPRGILLGGQDVIFILPAQGLILEEFAANLAQNEQWQVTAWRDSVIHDQPAVALDYELGGQPATVTLLQQGETVAAIGLTPSLFCDLPELGLTGAEVYARLVASFQWDE